MTVHQRGAKLGLLPERIWHSPCGREGPNQDCGVIHMRLSDILATRIERLGFHNRMRLAKRLNSIRFGHHQRARERAYADWLATRSENWPYSTRIADGWAVDGSGTLPHLDTVIAACEAVVAENRTPRQRRKDFMSNLLALEHFRRYPQFLDFATSPEIVGIIADYLGFVPVLSTMYLLASTPGEHEPASSQLFHLDTADTSQVKVFVYVRDVSAECGPLSILPVAASARARKALGYGIKKRNYRVTDDEMYAIVNRERDLKVLPYPKGTVVFADTSNCFHYGSRAQTGGRLVLMVQYLSPCRADWRNLSFSEFVTPEDRDLRKMVLDSQFLTG